MTVNSTRDFIPPEPFEGQNYKPRYARSSASLREEIVKINWKKAPECAKNWKQIPAILMFEFPVRRHFGSYYVIRLSLLLPNNGSFVHRFPKGMVATSFQGLLGFQNGRRTTPVAILKTENNGGNRNASSYPKWRHAENSNFKKADICFLFFVHLMLSSHLFQQILS